MGHVVAVRIVTTNSDDADEIKQAIEQAIEDIRFDEEMEISDIKWSIHPER